jgi:hypothetical protein
MVNSNPAVKDLADQITSSENNKEIEKSIVELKESIDSLSEEIKKRGVKSVKNSSGESDEDKLPFLTLIKGLSKGFLNPFTDTDVLEKQLSSKQEEIPADKLKTNELETDESTPEIKTKNIKENTTENVEKTEKKNKTKDPELNNRLLVSISQMLNELRENAVEKQLLEEAIKIRNILEKENTQIPTVENIISAEHNLTDLSNIAPETNGKIEPYLEEEKNKAPIVTANASTPPIHGEVIVPDQDNEEKKAKDRELLADAIANKLSSILGNLGGGTDVSDFFEKELGNNNSKIGKAIDAQSKKFGKLGKFGAISSLGASATEQLSSEDFVDEKASDYLKSLGIDSSETPNKNIENKSSDTSNIGSLDLIKNLLGADSVGPKPSPMSQNNKALPLQPKENQNAGSVLQNISKANEELKSQETQMYTQQMMQPIISNQTTTNNSQTVLPASPVPNQNTNSYLQWIKSRANY